MKDIIIRFDTDDAEWKKEIQSTIAFNNIDAPKNMVNNIYKSVVEKVTHYLLQMGYRPKQTLSYRKNLAKRWRSIGMSLSIKSKEQLWTVLNWFTDYRYLEDCFDVSLVISDMEKATKDIIFVNVNNVAMPVFPDTSNTVESISSRLIKLKQYDEVKSSFALQELISIVEILNKEVNIK